MKRALRSDASPETLAFRSALVSLGKTAREVLPRRTPLPPAPASSSSAMVVRHDSDPPDLDLAATLPERDSLGVAADSRRTPFAS